MTQDQNLIPWIEGTFTAPRQDLEPAYALNGALYWAKTKWLQEKKTFYSSLTLGYSMPVERSIDLDSALDWEWAKFLVKQGNV
jgi:N-acylneuraminate cytidylyltransferase